MPPEEKKTKIEPESPAHDEQPLEHIKPMAPTEPVDPDKPTTEGPEGLQQSR